jgi:hypothetical protein
VLAVWLRRGVRTESGIRIGSLRSRLLATYGRRLEKTTRDWDTVYLLRAKTAPPRPALGFVVQDGRVRAIGYGLSAEIGRAVDTTAGCGP